MHFILFGFVDMWWTLPPFHLQTVLWDLIVLREQLVYSLMECYCNITSLVFLLLNFFSKTTMWPFQYNLQTFV